MVKDNSSETSIPHSEDNLESSDFDSMLESLGVAKIDCNKFLKEYGIWNVPTHENFEDMKEDFIRLNFI